MDWIHCNACYHQPSSSISFVITSCGHIFCKKCMEQDYANPSSSCKLCNQKCTQIEINRQMKLDVQLFFNDPKDVAIKLNKQLVQVLEFQDGHRKRLIKQQQEQHRRIAKAIQHFQTEVKENAEIKKEIESLRAELRRLQEENRNVKNKLYHLTSGGQQRTPYVAQCRSRNVSPASGGRSPFNQLLMSFENAATSTPNTHNSTNPANRISLAPTAADISGGSGDRIKIGAESPAASEITTPKIIGLSQQRKPEDLSNPYRHMWSGRSISKSASHLNNSAKTSPGNVAQLIFGNTLPRH